jgi:hypothetical protein
MLVKFGTLLHIGSSSNLFKKIRDGRDHCKSGNENKSQWLMAPLEKKIHHIPGETEESQRENSHC